ncbi:MAG: sulfatase-like hydrolase/transferase [Saprospiraceae bacterium]|nr:sulfatase-like hydrolase/transferase [Saprospiraceae bacterium]
MILQQILRSKFALFLASGLLLCSCKEAPAPPNFVVILCDDLGYGDLGSFGHPTIQTPHLDEMAAQGIKLSSFYAAAPVCSPSRAGLLTGRSPNRAGIYDFIPGPRRSEDGRDLVHLQAHEQTIPALLKSAGYATCLSGKWHCSSRFNSDVQPTPQHFGFDHWFATHNNASPSHHNPKNFVRNGQKVGELEGYSCQLVVDEALQWLQNREENQPFFLQVNFHEPHEPIASPPDLVQQYLPTTQNENQAQYFANVQNMDLAVGRLLTYLKQNHGENTLIVFSSDNGPETLDRYQRAKRSYGSPGQLKGMKLWTSEAGFRVPGIIQWLGQPTYQGTADAVVSSLDFLPTFCELAGVELPKRKLDGESIIPLIQVGKQERSKPLLWVFYNALNQHTVALRKDDWKILCQLKTDTSYLPKINNVYDGNEALLRKAELADFVLYNLGQDVAETENVADKYPEVYESMKSQLQLEYADLLAGSHIWKRTTE